MPSPIPGPCRGLTPGQEQDLGRGSPAGTAQPQLCSSTGSSSPRCASPRSHLHAPAPAAAALPRHRAPGGLLETRTPRVPHPQPPSVRSQGLSHPRPQRAEAPRCISTDCEVVSTLVPGTAAPRSSAPQPAAPLPAHAAPLGLQSSPMPALLPALHAHSHTGTRLALLGDTAALLHPEVPTCPARCRALLPRWEQVCGTGRGAEGRCRPGHPPGGLGAGARGRGIASPPPRGCRSREGGGAHRKGGSAEHVSRSVPSWEPASEEGGFVFLLTPALRSASGGAAQPLLHAFPPPLFSAR